MGILQLGPFHIKYEWLFFLPAGIVTYFILKIMIKNKDFRREFIDKVINAAIIVFVIFKLSIIVFRPKIIFENPVAIIYLNGGTKGLILSVSAGIIYLFWVFRKKQWNASDVTAGMVYLTVSYVLSYWLVRTLFLIIF